MKKKRCCKSPDRAVCFFFSHFNCNTQTLDCTIHTHTQKKHKFRPLPGFAASEATESHEEMPRASSLPYSFSCSDGSGS